MKFLRFLLVLTVCVSYSTCHTQTEVLTKDWNGDKANMTIDWNWLGQQVFDDIVYNVKNSSEIMNRLTAIIETFPQVDPDAPSNANSDVARSVAKSQTSGYSDSIDVERIVKAVDAILSVLEDRLNEKIRSIIYEIAQQREHNREIKQLTKEILTIMGGEPSGGGGGGGGSGGGDGGDDLDPVTCDEVVKNNGNAGGIYTLHTRFGKIKVDCWKDPFGGAAWTVVMRRQDTSLKMTCGWKDYEEGFGSLSDDHWLGLKNIYHLLKSSTGAAELLVKTTKNSRTVFGTYSYFTIGNAHSSYTLNSVGMYEGDAVDRLTASVGQKFSTYDNVSDRCSKMTGWWYGRRTNCAEGWTEEGLFQKPSTYSFVQLAMRPTRYGRM